MLYALIKDNAIEVYPYSAYQLRRDNPNTSFPKRPSDELLFEWGVHRVERTARPHVDHTKNLIEGDPVLVNDTWTQVWGVADATPEEIAQRTEQEADSVRSRRDNHLADSDWRVIKAQETGAEVPVEWLTYRQSLRDISDHPNFPWLSNADWPVKPE